MARSILLWITPLIAADAIANLALLSCGTQVSPQPYWLDGWDADGTGTSSGSWGSPTATSTGSSGSGVKSNASSGPSGSSGSSGSVASSGSSGSPGGSFSGPPPPPVASDAGADVYVFPCGNTPCDLHFNTCCLPADAGAWDAAYCVGGIQTACGTNTATYHCLGAYDCPVTGNVCCGVYDLMAQTAATQCQTGSCTNPQFCYTDAECGGPNCVKQACQGVSPLYLCGLQAGPPYMCTLAP